jgi:hypothetical protein
MTKPKLALPAVFLTAITVMGVWSPGYAQATPYRDGRFACEKFDTFTVCDTLPNPSNEYKWTRCTFTSSVASGKRCETNRGNRHLISYPQYNIAMRLWDIEHGGSEHPTR